MAGRGPAPKPAHLRQRTNRKSGAVTLSSEDSGAAVPEIPNPDDRVWHSLTVKTWREWWKSPMAAQWLVTDVAGLGLLALLYDEYYKKPDVEIVKEIRLQRPCFGLTPLDRSRLQWEVAKADEAETRQHRRSDVARKRTGGDPRRLLSMVKS